MNYRAMAFNWFCVMAFIMLLLLAFTIVRLVRSEGSQCVADPIRFGGDKLAKEAGENIVISVSAPDKSFQYVTNVSFKEK